MSVEIVTKEKLAVCLYLDADCNLEPCIIQNALETVKASPLTNIEVYIYLDRMGGEVENYSMGKPELSAFDKYLVEQGNNPWLQGESQGKETEWTIANKACYLKLSYDNGQLANVLSVAEDLGAQNTGNASTLTAFLDWAKQESDQGENPATQYMLLLSDHGDGISVSFFDDTARDSMIPQQVADGIRKSTLGKVSVIAEDACIMATTEAISSLVGVAEYAVASEDVVGGDGFNYAAMLSKLNELEITAEKETAKAIADAIVLANDNTEEGGMNKKKEGTVTLSSNVLNSTMSEALNSFANKSDNFSEKDWQQLAKAFGNYSNVYHSTPCYVDLALVLTDSELAEDNISTTLKNAIDELKTALKNTVMSKMQTTTCIGEGLTVFSPIRASQEKLSKFYQYLAMTTAGNDSAWTRFSLELNKTAQKIGLIADIDKNALSGTYLEDLPIVIVDSGPSTVSSCSFSLSSLCYAEYLFDHNQYWTLTEPQWYSFSTNWVGWHSSTLRFEFTPYDSSHVIEEGDFVISIYGIDPNDRYNECYTVLKYEGKNAGGQNYIDIDFTEYLENKSKYCMRVVSTTTTAEYSLFYQSDAPIGAKKRDRYDLDCDGDSNNTSDGAVSLDDGNYYAGLIVLADEEEDETIVSHSDWYTFSNDNCCLTVTIVCGADETFKSGDVVVEQYSEKDLENPVATATGIKSEGFWQYIFEEFARPEEDKMTYLKISTTTEYIYNYSITIENVKKSSYSEKVLSTAIAKSNETGGTTLYWHSDYQATKTSIQLSADDKYDNVLAYQGSGSVVRVYNNSSDLEWRVRNEDNVDEKKNPYWIYGDTITAAAENSTPQCVTAYDDYVSDLLMARADGVWSSGYIAVNVGAKDGWKGTGETVTLTGKNKITDIFTGGGTDAAVLFLTDDANGDALFVDDIYSVLPDGVDASSRISKLTTIFAGAGDDVVDLTSKRYDYSDANSTLKVCGGEGNDTIWANENNTILCGDAGNDRLVGNSGDDIFAGGIGNDSINCGGGDDIACFCNDWGVDTITQLAGGSLVLWFTDGSEENWDETNLTYTDGKNSVTVSGIKDADIELRFGASKSEYATEYNTLVDAGLFKSETSSKIYESTLA